VRQGRTDAWIAHQLEVTVQQIQAFKREHGLEPDGEPSAEGPGGDDVDLRAEDDAAIAAELEAEEARRAEEEAKAAEEAARQAAEAEAAEAAEEKDEPAKSKAGDSDAGPKRARGRPRGRKRAPGPLEGTFDHGEEGYGLWLDPAVEDNPVYAEHWAGHRPVEVTIEEDQIVIRRAGGDGDDDA
jgi:hypothetical protein